MDLTKYKNNERDIKMEIIPRSGESEYTNDHARRRYWNSWIGSKAAWRRTIESNSGIYNIKYRKE